MSNAPPDDPIFSNRPIRRQPPKKSLPLIVKILLGLVGCGFLLFACCAGIVLMGIFHKDENPDEARAKKQAQIASGEQGFIDANRHVGSRSTEPTSGNSDAAGKLA